MNAVATHTHARLRYAPEPCTQTQARKIEASFIALALSPYTITEQHQSYCVVAGLLCDVGQSFREFIGSLTRAQAQRFIKVMDLARVSQAATDPIERADG